MEAPGPAHQVPDRAAERRMTILRRDDVPWSAIAHELVGADHGFPITVLFVDAPPGDGPRLHRHPYDELFIVQEGEATFTIDGAELHVRAGDVLIARANRAHAFVNSGTEPLRQIDIHLSPSFSTEWLDGDEAT
jgi:mannose-6-phosphate isomerase-like protein (cupin superfamily)